MWAMRRERREKRERELERGVETLGCIVVIRSRVSKLVYIKNHSICEKVEYPANKWYKHKVSARHSFGPWYPVRLTDVQSDSRQDGHGKHMLTTITRNIRLTLSALGSTRKIVTNDKWPVLIDLRR